MRKIIVSFLFSLISVFCIAQTGINATKYYITGSLSVGKLNTNVFADPSLWIDIGKDTTDKGIGLPKVILPSFSTTKTGVIVVNLVDSGVYEINGSLKRRILTLTDTILIKQLIAIYAGGSASWGSITGVINAQTDLQDSLNLKLNISKYISEVPSGTINGSNVTFVLAHFPVSGTATVYLNGLTQKSGSGNDYLISGSTITYLFAPQTGDLLTVIYLSQ